MKNQDQQMTDEEALAAYDEIAREFIRKVDSGEARSIRTVAALRRVLERRPEGA